MTEYRIVTDRRLDFKGISEEINTKGDWVMGVTEHVIRISVPEHLSGDLLLRLQVVPSILSINNELTEAGQKIRDQQGRMRFLRDENKLLKSKVRQFETVGIKALQQSREKKSPEGGVSIKGGTLVM